MYKIYLSPSSQSYNRYAYGNTNESEQCNIIAELTKEALIRCGFDVKKGTSEKSIDERAKESNAWNSDLHVAIHTNAFNGETGGTLVMVYDLVDENLKFAQPIYTEVQRVTPGTTDYGIRKNNSLTELKNTKCIAVYIEVDFHDNPIIAKWLIDHPKDVAEAITRGICKGFKVNYVTENTKTKLYRVQVGAFSKKENADSLLNALSKLGYKDAFIIEN